MKGGEEESGEKGREKGDGQRTGVGETVTWENKKETMCKTTSTVREGVKRVKLVQEGHWDRWGTT